MCKSKLAMPHPQLLPCSSTILLGLASLVAMHHKQNHKPMQPRIFKLATTVQHSRKLNNKLSGFLQFLTRNRVKAWSTSAADKFGCLSQGVGNRIKGTGTIQSITKEEIPQKQVKCDLKSWTITEPVSLPVGTNATTPTRSSLLLQKCWWLKFPSIASIHSRSKVHQHGHFKVLPDDALTS